MKFLNQIDGANRVKQDSQNRFVSDSEKSIWNSKSDTDTVTTINGKTGAITKADIVALGIPAQDTVYTHPANHPASIITQDSNNRFVTDVEKNNWNGKADVSDIPTSLSQLTNDSGFITINQVPQGIEVVQSVPSTTKSGQIIFLEVL